VPSLHQAQRPFQDPFRSWKQSLTRILNMKPRQASMVWLEPGRVHAGGAVLPFPGGDPGPVLARGLAGLPPGPSCWVVDDDWIPCLLVRDLAELPAGTEAREAYFQWRFSQILGAEPARFVQALPLGGSLWLLAGVAQELRETWIHAAAAGGHPIRSLVPRWLWLYNRLAPSFQAPGLLLSLRPDGSGGYSGTLAAWGGQLGVLRQWTDPASPELWNQDRMLPTLAYLQREGHPAREVHLWGAQAWPELPLPIRILPVEIPAQEPL
jgi:hypothetical protein